MHMFRRGAGSKPPPAAEAESVPPAEAPVTGPTAPTGRGRFGGRIGKFGTGFPKREARATRSPRGSRGPMLGPVPSFGVWIKATALDIFTMFVMGAIGLGVYFADPAPTRSFPVVFSSGDIVYPQFAYPLRREIVPIWAAAMLAFFVPFVIFLIVQIRVRSFWDLNNAIIGLLYSLICAAVFQVFLKWLIGGLRPHFLDVCDPNPAAIQGGGTGFGGIMYTRAICRGDKKQIDDSLESFPSGHTTAAFAGFVFLYLYLNAKLKVFANYHPAMWKLIAIYAPILGAVLIGGALTIDEFHNWYDVLAGAIIGTMFAFSSYRMVYAAVWDFRFNHIPLSREFGFMYMDYQSEFDHFKGAFWTRKAGWDNFSEGVSGLAMGAPFDATAASSTFRQPPRYSVSRRPVAGQPAQGGTGGIRPVNGDHDAEEMV